MTPAQRKWLELLAMLGSVDPNHRAATTGTKRACERRRWSETRRSKAFNVIVTTITEAGREALAAHPLPTRSAKT